MFSPAWRLFHLRGFSFFPPLRVGYRLKFVGARCTCPRAHSRAPLQYRYFLFKPVLDITIMEEFSQSRKEFLWLLEMRVVTGVVDGDTSTARQQHRHFVCDVAVLPIQSAGDAHCRCVEPREFLPERRLATDAKSSQCRCERGRIMQET
jgi:hypothetical protein